MKLYLKQKVFSWRDRSFVKDEDGNDRYSVEGPVLSLGKKLRIYDANNAEVAFIRQKALSLLLRYFIEIDGIVICELVKEFTFFRPRYRLDGLSWKLEGDIWARDYSITDNGSQVMRLSKRRISWGDSYELDIADPRNELLCLCIALSVDCILDTQNSSIKKMSKYQE